LAEATVIYFSRASIALVVFLLAGTIAAQETEKPAAEDLAGLQGDTSAIARSIGAIDEDLGSIDDLANAILKETGSLKLDNERLQSKIRELQRLNGEAGGEIETLNGKVAVLVDKAKVLGERYEEAIGIAQGYKAKYKRTRIAAFVLGAAALAAGGALVGVAAAR
jgi:chromosome segregation ATPase